MESARLSDQLRVLVPTAADFTGKERDQETGNDWFLKRYFGSPSGRFTGPDPMGITKGKLRDPQQWNMYAYARNNPLRFMDATGMYVCSGTKDQCEALETARQGALNSKDSKVVRAARAYGKPGEKNGVTVGFADNIKGDRGGKVTPVNGGMTADASGKLQVNLSVTIDSSKKGESLQETMVHEGSHVADYEDVVNTANAGGDYKAANITKRQSEKDAYHLSVGYSKSGNVPITYPCGLMAGGTEGSCTFRGLMMPKAVDDAIDAILNTQYDQKELDQRLYPSLQ